MAIDYTNIDEIINDFQLMMDDTSYDKGAQIYQLRLLALQGLRELTFDVEQSTKTTTLLVDSTTLQTTLPADYVKLIRVGFKGSNGDFHSLGYKSNLSLDATVSAQAGSSTNDENNPYFYLDVGKKFGIGGGNNIFGYYRINRDDNTINFSSDLSGKTVFMEYMSDGISDVQSVNHVIKLNFNSTAADEGLSGINSVGNLVVPHPTNGDNQNYLISTLAQAGSVSSSNIILESNDSSLALGTGAEIAEAFSTVINEGHPTRNLGPLHSNLRASQIDNSSEVLLIYSNITSSGVKSLIESVFNANTGDTKILSSPATLVQIGVKGSKPRIHKFSEEALRCYIYYKYIQRKRNIPRNEKQAAKRSYFNEKRLSRARMMNFNKETAMQVSRKAFKQSPKI